MSPPRSDGGVVSTNRYVRAVGVLGLLIVLYISLNTFFSAPTHAAGPDPGGPLPPFALPLAVGTLNGDPNVATVTHQGSAGNRPACGVRGPQILNVCQLYERGPVVLALIVRDTQCASVLSVLQATVPSYPGLQAAVVVLSGGRAAARRFALAHAASAVAIGYDSYGAIATRYRQASCPQIDFAYPGGVIDGNPLFRTPTRAQLDARLSELYAGSRARGWKPPASR